MTQAKVTEEISNTDEPDVEVPEQLLKDYQELNKKLEQTIIKIHKRKALVKLVK
jgi:hypothetical protein